MQPICVAAPLRCTLVKRWRRKARKLEELQAVVRRAGGLVAEMLVLGGHAQMDLWSSKVIGFGWFLRETLERYNFKEIKLW